MNGKKIAFRLLYLILELTQFVWVKMDKHKILLLAGFVGMILGQIARWIIWG